MHLWNTDRLYFSFLGSMLFFTLLLLHQPNEISYWQAPTIPFDRYDLQTDTTAFQDTLSDQLLYQHKTPAGIPLFYSQDITDNVCFDDKCRLLRITVYWNITGRYLGFALPKGEFLSKHDHEPFSDREYERLHALLADPVLPLGVVSFEKLIEIPASQADSIDGVTGATMVAVSEMVVKGAAYTTYTLWNIVYGPTKDFVTSLTEKHLSPELIDLILKSPDSSDRAWVLDRITERTTLTPELTATLLEIISGDDFFLTYQAIHAIKDTHLKDNALQFALFPIYQKANHNIRGMLVKKLMEAPHLSPDWITASRELLSTLNGKQLGDMLKLFSKQAVNDQETIKAVAEILKNENQFISRQAHRFLKDANLSDEEIQRIKDK